MGDSRPEGKGYYFGVPETTENATLTVTSYKHDHYSVATATTVGASSGDAGLHAMRRQQSGAAKVFLQKHDSKKDQCHDLRKCECE